MNQKEKAHHAQDNPVQDNPVTVIHLQRQLGEPMGWFCTFKGSSRILAFSMGLGLALVNSTGASAQVRPDSSLPINSIVTPIVTARGTQQRISGGTPVGEALLHSFESFSILEGSEVLFTPDAEIKTVIGRVTGGLASSLDGILSQTGNADLIILNPNGIRLGSKARLNLGGSFLATTANSITFSNGEFFSTSGEVPTGLMTLSTPLGLQFGTAPAGILLEGTPIVKAPQLSTTNLDSLNNDLGLSVNPQETFALLGGPVNLSSAVIVSPQSKVELGAIAQGQVTLSPAVSGQGWDFNYNDITQFEDINISDLSLIKTSGIVNGPIQLQGQDITIANGSQIFANTEGQGIGGNVDIHATGTFQLAGTGPLDGPVDDNGFVRTPQRSLLSIDLGAAGQQAGNLTLQAQQILIQDGGVLSAGLQGNGKGGSILLRAQDGIEVSGKATLLGANPNLIGTDKNPGTLPLLRGVSASFFAHGFTASLISVTNFSSGQSGDLVVETGSLRVSNGGIINAGSVSPLATGPAGDIRVTARDRVDIVGTDDLEAYPSAINIGPLTTEPGQPGNLIINTPVLKLEGGGRIGLDTTANTGGTAIINAFETVQIIGASRNNLFPSRISGQSSVAGTGGQVELTTKHLLLRDRGSIFAAGVSDSKGGNLSITADTVFLDNQAVISTGSRKNLGGNINLKIRESMVMRQGSQISAGAEEMGSGGDIFIRAGFILTGINENSDIVANAVQGQGGKITINADGVLGLKVSRRITQRSDISASSEVGIDGTVIINSPTLELGSAQVELNEIFEPPALAAECNTEKARQSSFVNTGRGGLPTTPVSPFSVDSLWQDLEPLPVASLKQQKAVVAHNSAPAIAQSPLNTAPQEAIAWTVNSNGEINLVAPEDAGQINLSPASTTCSGT